MAEYRVYALNQDGSIRHSSELYAGDDNEAVHLARLRPEKFAMEVWCGARKVALVPRPVWRVE
jgi:hypothetical protein